MKKILAILLSVVSLVSCSSTKHWKPVGSENNGAYRERFAPQDSIAEGKYYLFNNGKLSRMVPVGDYFAVKSIRTDSKILSAYSVYAFANKELNKLDIITPQSLIVVLTDDDNREIFEQTGIDLSKQHGINSLDLNLVAVDESAVMYSATLPIAESKGYSRFIEFYAITRISDNNLTNKDIILKYHIMSGDRKE